jgi:carboxyl-terminal processing protease
MTILRAFVALAVAALFGAAASANEYAQAARDLDETIAAHYAYLDKLPDKELPDSDALRQERDAVRDERTLLAYAENRVATLADHHAITGSSFRDSWAVVPTYTDLWIVKRGDRFFVDTVREASPAADLKIEAGDRIVSIGGVPTAQAVSDFWNELGLSTTHHRAEYAARVLVAGRRDRARHIEILTSSGQMRDLILASLYDRADEAPPPISVCDVGDYRVVRVNNSLGDFATIAAFDAAMRDIPRAVPLVLDLRNTPSGGNTTVARGILGWFVDRPEPYQIHNRPSEERRTGIARQWTEQVLPREGKLRSELPLVLVGRWTGSMGEGIAIGFAALGADIQGDRMAGLNGSVEDLQVGETDLLIKLPTERLMTVDGLPREDFVPRPIADMRLKSYRC